MSQVTQACGKCGSNLLADAPQGLCSLCLFKAGLTLLIEKGFEAGSDLAHVPTQFDDYELLNEIGRGGQGVVYRARQKSLNRTVALKVVGVGTWATETHLRRFRREAEAAASLNHPSIVPIHEIGERAGYCYFSMNLIDGGQLDEIVSREAMSPRRAAELVTELARTVHYAHEHGILHRDIKPGNILLDREGKPYLTDFGLARLVETESNVTRSTDVLGTPSYMAPEQTGGSSAGVTKATDIYGLGAVLYHLLTGRPPFVGKTTYETVRLLLETDPPDPRSINPKINRDLSTICLKCLEKDPRDRYPSALALAEDLDRWLRHQPIQARHIGVVTRGQKWLQRNPAAAAMVLLSLALVAAVAIIIWKSDLLSRPPTTGIAVLPFENLSNDREDASFADGVQDDLLTKLAKIADLKVISRTSVMGYRDQHNTREIGNTLGVSHVLEGSVRKTGAWLHINAQLIDARTDAHIWAEEYDRDLKDMFAVQSEITQNVAQRLHVKISAAESLAIKRPPTVDLTAFDLYSRAKNLLLAVSFAQISSSNTKANLLKAVDLLNRAVARDPTFFQAYCQLAWTHDQIHSVFGYDRTPARLALAKTAIDSALRLRPDSGEAHLARAGHLYRGYHDYNGALHELETARQTLPNDARLFELKGYIERRQAHWEESTADLERAVELDPRNILLLGQIVLSYDDLRRYAKEEAMLDRMSAIEPNDVQTKLARASAELNWKANTRPLHQLIYSIRATNALAIPDIADTWLTCALAERDPAAALNALAALGEDGFGSENLRYNQHFGEGLISRMRKDDARARSAFTAARAEQERLVDADPNDSGAVCVLGLIDAALGRKDDALREGRHGVELVPVEKDSLKGVSMLMCFAKIAAWAGDKDTACKQLMRASRLPGGVNYGELKLSPFWDPLRDDPCFDKVVDSLAPKGLVAK